MLVVSPLVPGMDQPPRDVAHCDALLARSTLEPGDNVWIKLQPHENFPGCFHGANYNTRLNIVQQQMLIRVSCRWGCGLSDCVKRDAAQDCGIRATDAGELPGTDYLAARPASVSTILGACGLNTATAANSQGQGFMASATSAPRLPCPATGHVARCADIASATAS